MRNTVIRIEFRIGRLVPSEEIDASAAWQNENRQSKTRAFPPDFSHRAKLRRASGCISFALFCFIVATQILIVNAASTTRQPRDDTSTQNRTARSRTSSQDEGSATNYSTEQKKLSVSAPTPTSLRSAPIPVPLRAAPTPEPFQLATKSSSSSSSPSSSSSQTVASSSVEVSTLFAPSTETLPSSQPPSFSYSLKPSVTDDLALHGDHTFTTTDSITSSSSDENNDIGEEEGMDYLIDKQTLQKGDLLYLKRLMDYQRQEIKTLRLHLARNNDQIIDIRREFREFREKQLTNIMEAAVTSSSSVKSAQTTPATLSSATPTLEQSSTSKREIVDPPHQFTPIEKEQQFLIRALVEPKTSPEPRPKPVTATNVPQTFTADPETETILKSPHHSDCSKSELRLFELQGELYAFRKQVNKTFNNILSKLAILEQSEDASHVDMHLKKKTNSNGKKILAKSVEREILRLEEDIGGRNIGSGVMNDAIRRANLLRQRIRFKKEKGNVPLSTQYIDSAGLKHRVSKLESNGFGRKTDDKDPSQSAEDTVEDVVKDDTEYRQPESLIQELESINEKVQLISDRLEDLQDQLMSVKENTSLSIKYVKNTLRLNSSLVDSFVNQQVGEKRETGREKLSKVHSISDHTIEDSGMRSKENDTTNKEKLNTIQKVKNGDSLNRKGLHRSADVGRSRKVTFSRGQFKIQGSESVHQNCSWLFDNVQSIQSQISDLDESLIELSSSLSKLSKRFPSEEEQRNETISEKLLTVTRKSTSDHLGQLLSQWSIRIHKKKTVGKVNRTKSVPKDDQPIDIYEVPEEETNSSQGVTFEHIIAINQSEEWKSGSQMISDSAEQLPEATYGMLIALLSWIDDLEAQIKKLKMVVDEMTTKITTMMSTVQELYAKHTENAIKEDAVNGTEDFLLTNSTVTKITKAERQNFTPTTSSPFYPQATPVSTEQTSSSTVLFTNVSDMQERFPLNRSLSPFENSGTDMSDSTTHNNIYNFTELEHSESNTSVIVTPIDKINSSIVESTKEITTFHSGEIRITETQNKSFAETGSLEKILENVQDLLKRVKKLESQVLELSEMRPLEDMNSELPVIQTDYLGSGATEEVPLASLEIVNKIAINMSNLQMHISNIQKNMTSQENQLNAVKNDVFRLDENMEYMAKELARLELKQRRDDRFYYSQQILESNLSLIEVANQVDKMLAPRQQLINVNLKELNDSLNKQWAVLDRLKEMTAHQETNISRITTQSPITQEKILYVDLKKRKYRIYNSTSVVKCSSMKDAERTFLNKKTQTCYYGYGNKKMLPYNAAKRKCEDAGLHIVFMETPEEREYVAKEITQEIGGHWIGAEKFDYGWYWVRGCDAVDPVLDPPWRYNHSVSYTRAIIWGDKWSGKYARQYYRFVCEEEPFKEEICDGFRSFERVHEWSSDALFRSFNTLHEVDCGRMCLADPDCKGFRFRKSGHHKCALYNRGNTTTEKKTICDVPGEVCYKRMERCFS